MKSLLDSILDWAKCKHEKLRVIGFLPNRDAHIVKCAQCGEMRQVAIEGVVQSEPLPKLAMQTEDDDVQY